MRTHAALLALSAAVLPAPAIAQDAGMSGKSRVNAIYVEQAPGLLIETRIARGATGSLVADVSETTPDGKVEKQLIRLPAGARVQVGQELGATSAVGATARSKEKQIVRAPSGPAAGIDCVPYLAGR